MTTKLKITSTAAELIRRQMTEGKLVGAVPHNSQCLWQNLHGRLAGEMVYIHYGGGWQDGIAEFPPFVTISYATADQLAMIEAAISEAAAQDAVALAARRGLRLVRDDQPWPPGLVFDPQRGTSSLAYFTDDLKLHQCYQEFASSPAELRATWDALDAGRQKIVRATLAARGQAWAYEQLEGAI